MDGGHRARTRRAGADPRSAARQPGRARQRRRGPRARLRDRRARPGNPPAHACAPSIVARSEHGLAGYALTMRVEARADVPILEPMFQLFEPLSWRSRPLTATRFYVM